MFLFFLVATVTAVGNAGCPAFCRLIICLTLRVCWLLLACLVARVARSAVQAFRWCSKSQRTQDPWILNGPGGRRGATSGWLSWGRVLVLALPTGAG